MPRTKPRVVVVATLTFVPNASGHRTFHDPDGNVFAPTWTLTPHWLRILLHRLADRCAAPGHGSRIVAPVV